MCPSFPQLDEQLLEKDVSDTLYSIINKVICARAPAVNGGKNRRSYTSKFKADVIHASEEKGVTVHALRYNLDHSMVVR